MAGITSAGITSAGISVDGTIGTNSVDISYSVYGRLPKDERDGDYLYEYNTPKYSWTGSFTSFNQSGIKTINNLVIGALNTISVSVKFSCDRDKYKWDEEEKKWIYLNTYQYLIDSQTLTLSVYTHPGNFTDYNFSSTITITSNQGLTVRKVNNWLNHCEKYLKWKNQSELNSTTINKIAQCRVKADDIITASWYNKCAELCNCSTRVSSNQNNSNSLITVQIFKDLGKAISYNSF